MTTADSVFEVDIPRTFSHARMAAAVTALGPGESVTDPEILEYIESWLAGTDRCWELYRVFKGSFLEHTMLRNLQCVTAIAQSYWLAAGSPDMGYDVLARLLGQLVPEESTR